LCVGNGFWSNGSMANIVTHSIKILDLSYFRFRRKIIFLTFLTLRLWGKINFKKSFDPRLWLVSFQSFAQKSVKIRKWFWESFRVGQDLEYGQIDNWNFYVKALLIRAKIKLRLTISKFCSFIHCALGLFALNTQIEGITKISLVNDFDHVTNKFFVFDQKKLKVMA
jgi:hypothetical protein